MKGIYKIWINDPNKIYVGSTITKFNRRKNLHLSHLRNNKHGNYRLQRDFNKYGEVSFNFEIHEEIKDLERAMERETYWYYEFLRQGYKLYNCHPPEEPPMLGRKHTKETKEKIGKKNKGKIPSKKTRKRISKAHKGKKLSQEHKDHIGKGNKGKIISKETKLKTAIAHGAKPFYVLKNGKIITEYINQRECARDLNLGNAHINDCLYNRLKAHKGYTFKYK